MTTEVMPIESASVQTMIDQHHINRLSADYMHALDRLDVEALKQVFHQDAQVDYGFFKGSAIEFCEVAIGSLKDFEATHHSICQSRIDVFGERAHGEVYLQAMHRSNENGLPKDFTVWGRYVDEYEKRDGVWKIAFRAEIFDFVREDPCTDQWLREEEAPLRGKRGDDDLSRIVFNKKR